MLQKDRDLSSPQKAYRGTSTLKATASIASKKIKNPINNSNSMKIEKWIRELIGANGANIYTEHIRSNNKQECILVARSVASGKSTSDNGFQVGHSEARMDKMKQKLLFRFNSLYTTSSLQQCGIFRGGANCRSKYPSQGIHKNIYAKAYPDISDTAPENGKLKKVLAEHNNGWSKVPSRKKDTSVVRNYKKYNKEAEEKRKQSTQYLQTLNKKHGKKENVVAFKIPIIIDDVLADKILDSEANSKSFVSSEGVSFTVHRFSSNNGIFTPVSHKGKTMYKFKDLFVPRKSTLYPRNLFKDYSSYQNKEHAENSLKNYSSAINSLEETLELNNSGIINPESNLGNYEINSLCSEDSENTELISNTEHLDTINTEENTKPIQLHIA